MKCSIILAYFLVVSCYLFSLSIQAQSNKKMTIRKLTTQQRDRLKNLKDGTIILNVDSLTYEVYDAKMGGWKGMGSKKRKPYIVGPRFCQSIAPHNDVDISIKDIIAPPEGGYIMTGSGNEDILLLKIGPKGDILPFQKLIGGNKTDEGASIIRTWDNHYLVGGYSLSFDTSWNPDAFLGLYTSKGKRQWEMRLGGAGKEECYGVVEGEGHSYYMVGYTTSYGNGQADVWVNKIDEEGKLQWSRALGGEGPDYGVAIAPAKGGGVVVTGITYSYGALQEDVYIARLNDTGGLEWTIVVGGDGSDYAQSIIATRDGGWLICGYSNSYSSNRENTDILVIKIRADGEIQWTRLIGEEDKGEEAYDAIQNHAGNYLVVGKTNEFGKEPDIYLVRLNKRGSLLWTETYGTSDDAEEGLKIVTSLDRGAMILGSTLNTKSGIISPYLVKIDEQGAACKKCERGRESGKLTSPSMRIKRVNAKAISLTPSLRQVQTRVVPLSVGRVAICNK